MDAQADAGRLGHVLHQLHLAGLAVVTDPVELISLAVDRVKQAHLPDPGGDAVQEDVLAALGRVDELESVERVLAVIRRIGTEVVRDRARVAVIPVRDPGDLLAGLEVDGVRAAAQLLGREEDIGGRSTLIPPMSEGSTTWSFHPCMLAAAGPNALRLP